SGLWLIYSRKQPSAQEATLNKAAFPTGLVSGVLSGLFSMAGPVVIVFLAAGTKDPRLIRARLVFISFFATLTRMAALLFEGVYTHRRLEFLAISIPAICAGLAAGVACARFVKPGPFRVLLGLIVAVAGIAAAIKVLI